MPKVFKSTKKPKQNELLYGFSMPKKHPLPKFKKATKAEIEKKLALYEEWLQLQRDGKLKFDAGDATDWIREDRTKDYGSK